MTKRIKDLIWPKCHIKKISVEKVKHLSLTTFVKHEDYFIPIKRHGVNCTTKELKRRTQEHIDEVVANYKFPPTEEGIREWLGNRMLYELKDKDLLVL